MNTALMGQAFVQAENITCMNTALMGVMLLAVENITVGRIASMVKKYVPVANLMAVFTVRTVAMWLVVVGTDNMS